MIPHSYVRVFQIVLSQIHSDKFKQHFGAAIIDGTLHTPIPLHTPIQMFPTRREVAESAASVGESAASVAESDASVALATKFQMRLFSADTRLAIDDKTSFLNNTTGEQLVTDVRNFKYKGKKLWTYTMKRITKLAREEFGKEKTLSPALLNAAFQQIMAKAFMGRWERAQDSERDPKVGQKVLHEQQSDQEKEKMDVEEKEEHEAQRKEEKTWELIPIPQETPKPQEEGRVTVTDLDALQPRKPEAFPPTHDPELDEALADLAEPVAIAAESVPSPVAESAAESVPSPVAESAAESVGLSASTSYPKIDAAARAAYNAIKKFRQEVIQDRIQSCRSWILRNMSDFKILSVEVFGSACYHLELCTSDIDMAVILDKGCNISSFLKQLRARCIKSPSFDADRKTIRRDCLMQSYMGMHVDIKPIRVSRENDQGCRTSDELRALIEQRMMHHQESKLQAIVIFKLLVHHLKIVQHHFGPRHHKFKAVSLSIWAVLVLDGMPWENHGVGDFVHALCQNFVDFDWQGMKVVVSGANNISLQPKGDTLGTVCIMCENGTLNSTSSVNLNSLIFFQDLIKKALPNLEQCIDEALKGQGIDEKRQELGQMREARKHVEAMHFTDQAASVAGSAAHVAGSAASVPSQPSPAKVSGFVSAPSQPPSAKVAGSAAEVAGPPSSMAVPVADIVSSAAHKKGPPPGTWVWKAGVTTVSLPPPGAGLPPPAARPPPPAAGPPPPAADSVSSGGPPAPPVAGPPPAADSVSSGGPPPPPPAEAAPSDVLQPAPPPPMQPPELMAGEYPFDHLIGIIKAPPDGTDHEAAPIVIIAPPSGGFDRAKKKDGGHLKIPVCCPKPCWYAYMDVHGGRHTMELPRQFVEFIEMLNRRAKSRAIIGWGLSRGAKWLMEVIRNNNRLLDAAVLFAPYPQIKCPYEQKACADELIAITDCAICLLHFAEDDCCGVHRYPHWHAKLQHHMATQVAESAAMVAGSASAASMSSPLLSLTLSGDHDTAVPIWLEWQVQCDDDFNEWFEMMWHSATVKR